MLQAGSHRWIMALVVLAAGMGLMTSCGEDDPVSPGDLDTLRIDEDNITVLARVEGGGIDLDWTAVPNSFVDSYRVLRSVNNPQVHDDSLLAEVEESGYRDEDIHLANTYRYKIGVVSSSGRLMGHSAQAAVVVQGLAGFQINDGAEYTARSLVDLHLDVEDADSLWVWNGTLFAADSANGEWIVLQEKAERIVHDWQLPAGPGSKQVNVSFRYTSGLARTVSDVIQPEPIVAETFLIEGGAEQTPTPDVELTLAATGVTEMLLSNRADFANLGEEDWEPFTTSRFWTLNSGTGTKHVYVRYRNDFGIESETICDGIEPQPIDAGEIAIAGGSETVPAPDVELTLTATGATEMLISNNADFVDRVATDWEPFTGTRAWILESGPGAKSVYIKYRNAFGFFSDVIHDSVEPTPMAPSLLIAAGDDSTATRSVELTIAAVAAVDMLLSDDPVFAEAEWESYAATRPWTLPRGAGTKSVHLRTRDAFGIESATVADSIEPASMAVGSIVINDDRPITALPYVTLSLSVSGADSMLISNLADFSDTDASDWEPYVEVRVWALSDGIGVKTVHVKFRNEFGIESQPVEDSIERQSIDPGELLIDGGAEYTAVPDVQLTMSAIGAAEMLISNLADFSDRVEDDWEAYLDERSWRLTEGSGVKSVFVKFRDGFRYTSPVISASIEPQPMAPSVIIEDGAASTPTRDVALALGVAGATEMILDNDAGFAGAVWETAVPTRDWTLAEGAGVKTVHLRTRNGFGMESAPVSDDIEPQAIDPGMLSIDGGEAVATVPEVELALSAVGAAEMLISDLPDFSDCGANDWETYAPTRTWTLPLGPGVKTVHVKFRNDFGFESGVVSDDIEAQPIVEGTLGIAGGAAETDTPDVTLSFDATGATEMLISDLPNFSDRDPEDWEPFSTTRAWVLPLGDGTKTVHAKFRNAFYESGAINDDIEPRSIDPGEVEINGGDEFTVDPVVTLALTATGATEMLISDLSDFSDRVPDDWQAFAAETTWTLPTGAGEKTVYVKYRNAFAFEAGPVNDAVSPTPMDPSIRIAGDIPATASLDISLELAAAGAQQMQLSLLSHFPAAVWIPFVPTPSWTLLPVEGAVTIYARFINDFWIVSDPVQVTIVLDQTPPDVAPAPIAPLDGEVGVMASPTLEWTAAGDAICAPGDLRYRILLDVVSPPTAIAGEVTGVTSYTASGLDIETTYYWRVIAMDQAGNETPGDVRAFDTESMGVNAIIGTPIEGALLTLHGTLFGTGPRILSWHDFDAHAAGAEIDGLAPAAGLAPTWEQYGVYQVNQPYLNPVVSGERSVSGSNAAKLIFNDGLGHADSQCQIGWGDLPEGPWDRIYVSYMRYMEGAGEPIWTNGSGNHKTLFIQGSNGSVGRPQMVIGATINGAAWLLGTNGELTPGGTGGWYVPGTGGSYLEPDDTIDWDSTIETWQRWEVYCELNAPLSSANDKVQFFHDLRLMYQDDATQLTDDVPLPYYKNIRLGHLDQSYDEYDFAHVYLDDVYIADSRARLEVGDDADLLSCTRRDIQIPVSWSDGAISFNLRTPSFTGGGTRYVFVITENGDWASRELD